MSSKWQGQPKLWRVRGVADDGLTVTLGNHDTKEAAQAEADKFIKEKYYRDVRVEPIVRPETPKQPDE